MSAIGDRLNEAFAGLRAELAPRLAELGDAINAKIDELQAAIAEVSAKLDEAQGAEAPPGEQEQAAPEAGAEPE